MNPKFDLQINNYCSISYKLPLRKLQEIVVISQINETFHFRFRFFKLNSNKIVKCIEKTNWFPSWFKFFIYFNVDFPVSWTVMENPFYFKISEWILIFWTWMYANNWVGGKVHNRENCFLQIIQVEEGYKSVNPKNSNIRIRWTFLSCRVGRTWSFWHSLNCNL
jgi:hypothetical protein